MVSVRRGYGLGDIDPATGLPLTPLPPQLIPASQFLPPPSAQPLPVIAPQPVLLPSAPAPVNTEPVFVPIAVDPPAPIVLPFSPVLIEGSDPVVDVYQFDREGMTAPADPVVFVPTTLPEHAPYVPAAIDPATAPLPQSAPAPPFPSPSSEPTQRRPGYSAAGVPEATPDTASLFPAALAALVGIGALLSFSRRKSHVRA